ncbi:MAG: NUDIX hydrolase [Candidatus Binataceae bacterium]
MPRRPKSKPGPPAAAKARLRREVSAGGIVWRPAKGGIEIAMIRPHGSDAWALPKGHVEKDESAERAATREVREETGLDVSGVRTLGDVAYVFSWRDKRRGTITRVSKTVHFFLMEFAGGDTADHDDEIDEVAWVPIEAAIERASYANERVLIEKARAQLKA